MSETLDTDSASRPARSLKAAIFPPLAYLIAFFLLTWPWARHFNTDFFCDRGDGFQNVWNLWWVRTAVLSGRSPWFTSMLHVPGGTSLLGQTLNPFNGLIGIPLAAIGFSPVVVHNTIVTFSFVATGVTAFWLAMDLTGRRFFPSLFGGFAFTFTEYHFAHAQGHLQLVSTEWLPLFVLAWMRLVRSPTVRRGIVAGFVLWLVLLCDYYYFFYAVLTAGAYLLWNADGHFRAGKHAVLSLIKSLAVFGAVTSAFCLPVIVPLLRQDLLGAHGAEFFSADFLAPFIPGGHWWAGRITSWYWSALPNTIHENSIYLGASAVVLAIIGLVFSRRRGRSDQWFWVTIAALFFALSLGPVLHVHGRPVWHHWMPYTTLERVFPPLKMSGMPIRMIVMVSLATSMLAACGLKVILERSRIAVLLTTLFVAWLFVDLWPAPLPFSSPAVPVWVTRLRDLPQSGAVLDTSDTGLGDALYFQTIYQHPMAFGYISRVPRAVSDSDRRLQEAIDAGDWRTVRTTFGIRHVVLNGQQSRPPGVVVLNRPERVIVELVEP